VRQEMANQYTIMNRMDQGIGLILQELENAGVLNDTLIIYFSDNNIPFPGAKTNLYDSGMGEPLIVVSPQQTEKGVRCSKMVSSLDFVPTILDWVGVPLPNYTLNGFPVAYSGKSILPLLNNTNLPGYDHIFASHQTHEGYMYYPMRVIRDSRFKLIYNIANPLPYPIAGDIWTSPAYQELLNNTLANRPTYWYRTLKDYSNRPQYELYDMVADPKELNNLASQPAYAPILQSMQTLLKQWQEATNDPWAVEYIHH